MEIVTSFTEIYNELVRTRTYGLNYNHKLREITRELRETLPTRRIRTTEIWSACLDRTSTGRQNDLLFRLLHGQIKTGTDLHWLGNDAQRCPVDGEIQTKDHLWVECTTAKQLWEQFAKIWAKIEGPEGGSPHPATPRNMAHLIGLLAITPYPMDPRSKRPTPLYTRYRTMAHAAVCYGQSGKSIRSTKYQYGEHPTFRTDEVLALFETLLTEYIRRDRTTATSYQYANAGRHNPSFFKKVWGITTGEATQTPVPILGKRTYDGNGDTSRPYKYIKTSH